MSDRIHTWAREYIHGRENTYMSERIHTWAREYIHGRENTYIGERIHELTSPVHTHSRSFLLTHTHTHTYTPHTPYHFSPSQRVKSGVVIGFFLRAFRVCSDEHLASEISYIKKVFMDLKYPERLWCRLKEKAKKIKEASNRKEKIDSRYICA